MVCKGHLSPALCLPLPALGSSKTTLSHLQGAQDPNPVPTLSTSQRPGGELQSTIFLPLSLHQFGVLKQSPLSLCPHPPSDYLHWFLCLVPPRRLGAMLGVNNCVKVTLQLLFYKADMTPAFSPELW